VQLTVSDGHWSVTKDISRDVARTHSNPLTPDLMKWIPLKTTAVLANSNVEKALSAYIVNGVWDYDKKNLRLFRWMNGDWAEYQSARSAQFTFTPGGVIWLKTRQNSPIDLGSGRTVSLKSPCPITLPANSWTDISVPYEFNVRVGDLLLATGLSASDEKSIAFYEWQLNGNLYHAEPVYLPSNPDKMNKRLELARGEGKAYTVFNGLSKDIVLQIPPLPPINGLSRVAKQQATPKGWSVAVRPTTADGDLSAVYCGYLETLSRGASIAFPQPPSFSKVSVGVYDEKKNLTYGSFVTGEQQGYAYQLVFANRQDESSEVRYSVERGTGLPQGMKIVLIDPSTASAAATSENGSLSVSMAGQSREYRWLVIGNAEFTEGFGKTLQASAFDLLRTGPNPFSGMVRIRYTLPLSGIQSVRCAAIDQRGRIVWSKNVAGSLHPGRNEMLWTPRRLAAGTYILRLSGLDGRGRIVCQKQMRVMYLP
jgi:hypothetical protein